jgi:hypothetical protein
MHVPTATAQINAHTILKCYCGQLFHIIQSRNFYNIHIVETDFLKFVAGTRPCLSNQVQPSNHYRLQLFSPETTYGSLTCSHSVISSYLQAQCDKFRQCNFLVVIRIKSSHS